MKPPKTRFLLVAAALFLGAAAADAGDPALRGGFARPPGYARPWVYWFWINGNISTDAITADLEAMQRVGIGGVLIMEVDPGLPAGPVAFGSAQWRELFRFACGEAKRLGLEVNLSNDAGWTGSAGPWITPELSMQRVVWTETKVRGPRHFEEALAEPARVAGYYRDIVLLGFPTPPDDSYRIADIDLKATFISKTSPYGTDLGIPRLPITFPELPKDREVDRSRILNLTARMKDGRLSWDVPDGNWTILRFGHTSTGVDNHPAPEGGRGLECDKLSRAAADVHFAGFLGKIIADAGPLAGDALVSAHIDSWEVGAQNWTPLFGEEFQKRNGYDLVPFMPTLTGRVVGDLETSERFLWDFRRTISDLLNENYAGRLRELANRHGLRLSIEAYDATPVDDMSYAGRADEPQAEFWLGRDFFPGVYRSWEWCGGTVSAAHVYGKPVVAAEAFTSVGGEDWLAHPASMKSLGDWAFCEGINRLIFHRYAMQPWKDRKPGMTMGPWGVHYERTQTWWEQSKPWHEYLARCQYLLRQGRFVADLCYLQPEGAPMRFQSPGVDPASPEPPVRPGYNYDGCSPEVVLTRMSVKDGRLVLPDGTGYRAMVLPGPGAMPWSGTMTPGLLSRILELVEAGATVVGPRPLKSPSLSGYPECDTRLAQLAGRLWGDCDGKTVTEHRLGKGRVIWGPTPQQVLAEAGVPADFSCGKLQAAPFRYTHRHVDDGTEIYFVANRRDTAQEAVCVFRVSGMRPEFWWPETGRVELPARYDEGNGCVSLPLRLPESGSVFVVFTPGEVAEEDRIVSVTRDGAAPSGIGDDPEIVRLGDGGLEAEVKREGTYVLGRADGREHRFIVPAVPGPVNIEGPWDLQFPQGWGAPPGMRLDRLVSWTECPDPGVRYFSGKASYRRTIQVPSSMVAKGSRAYLDLGGVEVIASVRLNGRDLGILWKPPFRVEITGVARPGDNLLEVDVTNLWPNRLIGDAQLPDDCEWVKDSLYGKRLARWPAWLLEDKPSPVGRFTFATWNVWSKDATLIKSGLLGPVTLQATARVSVPVR